MPTHTLTLRLDEETDAALKDMQRAEPKKAIADLIREAITEKRACVYFIRRSDGAVKIGFTGSLRTRMKTIALEVGNVTLEAAIPGGRPEEKALHVRHKKCRLTGEWFKGEPIEAEIRAALEAWGPPDVDVLSAVGMSHVGFRLPKSVYDRLQAHVDAANEQCRTLGLPATVTVGSWVRQLILDKLSKGGDDELADEVFEPEHSETELPTNGHHGLGVDERTVKAPMHTKRVNLPTEPSKPVTPPIDVPTSHPGPIVDQSEPSPEPEGPPDDNELEALLKDTHL